MGLENRMSDWLLSASMVRSGRRKRAKKRSRLKLELELLEDRVVLSSPSLSTIPGGTVVVGSGVNLTDSATLSGGISPTGSITFTLTAPGGGTVDTERVTVSGDGIYNTPSGFLPSTPGTYQWAASYSGDVNNDPVASVATEAVNPASPSLVTAPSPTALTLPATTSLADSATLSGGYNETGTITFTLTAPGGAVVQTQTVPVNGDGTYRTSSAGNGVNLVQNGGFETGDLTGWTVTPASSGSDYFLDNDPSDAHSGNYSFWFGAVSGIPDTLTQTQTLATVPGNSYTLSYWVSHDETDQDNDFQVSWGGNVVQDLHNASAFGWTNYSFTVTATSTSTVLKFSGYEGPAWYALDDVSVSGGYTPAQAGTYQWNATYSGDSNNNPASDNNLPAEQVTVSPPLPTPPSFTADTPPAATVGSPYSYQFQASGTAPMTFSATGLPAWAQLNPSTGVLSGTPDVSGTFNFSVTASNGTAPDATANVSLIAQYEPPVFTADTPPVAVGGSPYSYQFQAIGTGPQPITYSATGLPAWAQLNSSTGVFSGTPTVDGTFNFSVTASDGVAPDPTVNVSLLVAGGANTTFNVAAGINFTVPNGNYAGGTTFNVGANANVTIDSGTFTGGAIFNVGTGAVVNIIDSPTFSGTLTGGGGGSVQVGNGRLYVGSGGLTLNFAGSMFQWTSGQMDLGNGSLTNLGTMTITSPVDFYNDGILDNFGTIIQTGTGNLQLGTDGTFPSTLNIEAGAYYLLEGDGGLTEISDSGSVSGQTALYNAGIIRKTAGSGTSSIGPAPGYGSYGVFGSITNTGIIEADSGTISLNSTLGISELSGNSLTGGTWNALDGASLQFPSGTAITSNQAKLTLGGAGATIGGIAGLASNSGTFVVTNGANFTTAGGFTNSGSLTVGPGSIFTVSGNFTQTSTGALNDQIGGTPASSLFGQVAVTGTATLAGAFNLALVNGFSPSSGQTFDVMSFASTTGSFISFNGLSPFFTESLSSTGLDIEDAATEAVDLAATSVTAPTTADVGQSITVNWQATDQSSQATTGSWQDSVYISPTPTITSSSTLLGMVPENITLAGGAPYNASLTATLPAALAPGYYYVLVQVDSLYQLPDPNRANNTLTASTGEINIGLPALTLNTPYADSFTAADQNHYYQITVPAGGSLNVSLQSSASSGAVALYISQGTLPTLYNYQQAAVTANQPNQTAVVPQVLTSGTYYILAHSVSGAAATAGFTVTVTQTAAVTVSAISPHSGGNAGNVTVEIDGTNFTAAAIASLTLGGATINDSTMDFVNASQMFATFNLAGAAVGNYNLSVQQGAQSVTAPSTFQVVATNPASLNVALLTPQYIRSGSGRTGTVVVTYTNVTANDLVAPLLEILSTNTKVFFSTPDDPNDFVQTALVLAVAPTGPAGILRPGQSGQLTLTLQSNDTISGDAIPVQVSQIKSGQTIDWASQQAALQPANEPAAAWNVIYGNFVAEVGTTSDSYNAALAQAATYLSSLGESTAHVSDVGTLWSFLVSQAGAAFPGATLTSATDASLKTPGNLPLAIDRTFVSSIAGRYSQGTFGLGWTTSWQTSLTVDGSGDVTINSGGGLSFFPRQANGTYSDTNGENGSLTVAAGIYTFTANSRTQDVFLPSGLLNYEQDANGNRITLGYNGQSQLVTLTYSNPSDPSEPTEQLSLTYNTQGFVSQAADGTGNVWTYTYDTAGHLLSVIAPGPTSAGLTTSYTYDTGSNPETANAMLSITYPDGSQKNFSYDALGRLSGTNANGGTEATTYSYMGEAEVQSTDAAGDVSIVWYNELGLASRVQDPLGGISTYLYDNNANVVSYTNAAGDTYQYTYDQSGNLTKTVNPLGQTVQTTYNELGDLTSVTDANNNTTEYSYSSTGSLLSIAYPDGTQQSFTYDPLGNLSETIEQKGDPVSYQHNALGLVAQENFADGTYETFGYDAHGNMLTAQTYNAGGTLTGTTTLTYNGANQLTSVSYPGGLSLTFIYNAQGQRTQSVDQSSYTINYGYDTLGRLSELTDGSDNPIVQYTYNSLGKLQEKLNWNSAYTTYAYDAAGNLTREINYAGGTTVNSSFTYIYNVLNEMTSMTDAGGNVTTYGYDAIGQLTQVTLPGGATIAYVYNAAGDRTEVLNSATATSYSSNADNEITQVGSTTYTYGANGNLASVTNGSGTTTYTYNDLNQLVSIAGSDGTAATFQYSPLGYLVAENVNGTQTSLLVNPTGLGNVVASYNGSGSLIADYNYGLGLVSQTGPSGTGYYDFDANGNTVGITGSSGTYVNQYSYLPFGETTTVTAVLPNPFTFAGQFGVMQIDTSLFYMRARDYTPATGQFLSNDPSNLAAGDANIRRYVGNNPAGLLDASGLKMWTYNQSTGQLTESLPPGVYGPPQTYQGYSGNGTGFDNPSAQNQSNVGPIPQSDWTVGPLSTFTGASGNTHPGYPLTPEPGTDTFGRDGFYLHSDFGNPTDSSHGCIVFPPNVWQHTVSPGDTIHVIGAEDPNALIGPAGYGTPSFIQPTGTLPYTIDFENDGTAAAQDVIVTEQLDPNLNWSTFQLGSFGFGTVNITVPTGLTQYQTTVSYQNSDGSSLNVQVSLDFNVSTGLLTVSFVSLDPLTHQAPTGVFDGFLYPESESPVDSDGYVEYTIQPNSGLTTGTAINQQASVVFDTNAALNTAMVTNTIDAGPPTSSVAALPATESTPSFTVSWSGSDVPGGSGIATYAIYDSDNGGLPYQLFMTATAAGSATFTGQAGHTYSFYSVATDNVGNVQPTPTAAQATTMVQLSQAISFGPLANQTYGAAPFSVSASASSGLAVSFSIVAGGQYASISGNTITLLGATPTGTVVTVAADQAGNGNYSAAPTVDQSFTIAQASQTISFGSLANQTYGAAPFSVSASASSGLAVSFSIVAGGQYASISGNTITLLGATPAGTVVTVAANQAGNGNYSAAPTVDQPFTIAQASQTISFGSLANQTYGAAPFSVSASASSGLAVSFSIVAGGQYASISGNTITLVGATPTGTVVTVAADQAGNGNYSAAPTVDQSFTIAQASQTISFGSLVNQTYGAAPFSVSASASSGLAVSFSIVAGGQYASISGNTITLLGATPTGTVVTVAANQAGNGNYSAAPTVDQSFTIAQASQTISFGSLANQTYGAAPFSVSASASSGLAVSFSIVAGGQYASICGNTITLLGATPAGTVVTVAANQAGNGNYSAAPTVDQSFTIAKANQTITVTESAPVSAAYRTNFTVAATASSGLGVSIVASGSASGSGSGSATITITMTSGTATVTFSQAGNANYNAATVITETVAVTAGSANTSTQLASSANPAVYGQQVTFTATVTNTSGTGVIPTGSVQFVVDGTNFGAAVPLDATGHAVSPAVSFLAGASQTVQAVYKLSPNFVGSNNSLTQVVQAVAVEPDPSNSALTDLFIGSTGATSNDQIQVNPVGKSNTGSTGVKVQTLLNGVNTQTTYSQPFTNIYAFLQGGNENVQLANTLTINTIVMAGNGNDSVTLGNGNNTMTLGNGNDNIQAGSGSNTVMAGNGNDNVQLGDGNNNVTVGNGNDNVQLGNGNDNVTVGNGNDNVQLGNGSDVIVEGNGNDNVSAGNGSDLVVGGLGQHTIQLGNGNDILIDGSATVVNPGDSLRQILSDWNASSSASVDTRLKVVYNTTHPNVLKTGCGRDWFFFTYSKDVTNKKSTDRLN